MNTFEIVLKRKLNELTEIFNDAQLISQVDAAVDAITSALINGNKLTAIGNGGSFSNADHLVGEFTGRFRYHRKPIAAFSLNGLAGFTAISNDYGYEYSYSRQIRGIMNEGDVLVAYSASGNSPNIVDAVNVANEIDVLTIGFTGTRGKLKEIADFPVMVDSIDIQNIEEAHYLMMHIICEMIEERWVEVKDTEAEKKDYAKK